MATSTSQLARPSHSLSRKERMFRALSGDRPDCLPAAPAYLSLYLADRERDAYVEQYRRRLQGCSRCRVDHGEDTHFRVQALRRSYEIFQEPPDWIEVSPGATRAWADRTEIVTVDDVLYYHDAASGIRVPMARAPIPYGDGDLSQLNSAASDLWDLSDQIQGPEDVDRRIPLLSPEELLARGDLDLPRQLVEECGDQYFLSTVLDTPFSDAYDLLGFRGLMLSQRRRPNLLHYLLRRKLQQTQQVITAWARLGIHGIYVEEVFSGADIISPRSYEEFVLAYNTPLFRHARAQGLLAIHYVCGDVIPRLEQISQMEIAAVAVEESKKGFRIALEEVVERVRGRVTILGNIDTIRFGLHATSEEMAAEARRQAAIGSRARGFVVSTGSPFPLETNPRLIDALVEAAHALEA